MKTGGVVCKGRSNHLARDCRRLGPLFRHSSRRYSRPGTGQCGRSWPTPAQNPDLYITKKFQLDHCLLAFNYKIKELQDPQVREAVAHAFNKQAIVESFLGENGQVAKTLVPPFMWGYNDAIEDWAYDPELSKQLLAEAGFPDGISE